MPATIENIVYQHAENVCFLWSQRQLAVVEPHYSLKDLVHLDDRLEANIDGIRIAGEHGYLMIDEMIELGDEGAYFGKALLALEHSQRDAFLGLVEIAEQNDGIRNEIAFALAWVHEKYLQDTVREMLESQSPAARMLGLAACVAHGRNPGRYLLNSARHTDYRVRSAACHSAANLGYQEFLHTLRAVNAVEEKERYEQARALAMLGNQSAARTALEHMAFSDSKYRSDAVALLMSMSDSTTGRTLLKQLISIKGRERDVVVGFGLLGDPIAMDWLIGKCEVLDLARLAGGAITMIAGIDLAYEDLDLVDSPEGFEAGPDDDPANESVAMDEDENLPWPDPERVRAWWNEKSDLLSGMLYLNGRKKDGAELIHVLDHGMQRQRTVAAMTLALKRPDAPYRDTRLPMNKQMAWTH